MFQQRVLLASFLLVLSASVHAQHAGDLLVDYQGGKIFLKPADHPGIYESEFSPANLVLGEPLPFTSEPGFDTLGEETGEYNLVIGDIISYRVLGPVIYHDGTDFANAPADVLITRGVTVTVTGTSGFQGPFGIGGVTNIAGNGIFHKHLNFQLSSSSAPAGAYAIEFDWVSSNPAIAPSDPFKFVFNWNLSESEFETAVEAIAIPEVGSMGLTAMASVLLVGGTMLRRRRASNA
jgi:hypothetical protein